MRIPSLAALAVLLASVSPGAGASTTGDGAGRQPLEGWEAAPTARVYSFTVTSSSWPLLRFAATRTSLAVELRNDGELIWSEATSVAVSYHLLDAGGELVAREGPRTPIQRPVSSGGSARVELSLRAPRRPGLYRVQPDLVQSGVLWFSSADPTPAPRRWLLVLPQRGVVYGSLLPICVAATLLLAGALGRRRLAAAMRVGDLVWLAFVAMGLPYLLYDEMGMRPAASALLPALALTGVAVALLVLLPPRRRPWVSWALAVGGTAMLWGDVLYYRFFADVAPASSLQEMPQVGDLGATIAELAAARDLMPAISLLLGALLVAVIARRNRQRTAPRRRWTAVAIVALAALAAVSVHRSSGLRQGRNMVAVHSVETMGLYAFHLVDLGSWLFEPMLEQPLGDAQLEQVVTWFRDAAPGRAGRGPWFGAAAGKNLLMIQVESLQEFVLDRRVGDRWVAPNLRRLAEQSLSFSQLYDQTSKGRSSAGDFVVQTSLLPVGNSVAYDYVGNSYRGIGQTLGERGYATVSAIPFRGSFWNRHRTHPAYGYGRQLFADAFEPGERVGWGLNDLDFLSQMVPKLEALPQPFCVWLTTLSVHYPYEEFPDHLKQLDLGELDGPGPGNYLHGMHLMDEAIGRLLDDLQAAGLLESTVIAVWGDHDSGLLREARYAKQLGIDIREPRSRLVDRIPFIVRLPGGGRPRPGSLDLPAGQLDIAPTLLALLGVDPAPLPLQGRNLLGDPPDVPIVHPRGGWVDGSHVRPNDGGCFGRDLAPLPRADCAAGQRAAQEQIEVATAVLAHDLQPTIERSLADSPAAGGSGATRR